MIFKIANKNINSMHISEIICIIPVNAPLVHYI